MTKIEDEDITIGGAEMSDAGEQSEVRLSGGNLPLFRPQAIQYRRRKLYGDVFLDAPLSNWVLVGLISLIVSALAMYAVFGTYEKSETVKGYIAPQGGVAQLYAPRGGIISEVFVKEGEHVEQGQKIAKVTVETQSKTGPVSERLAMEVGKKMEENSKQLEGAKTIYDVNIANIDDKILSIKEDIKDIKERIDIEEEKIRIMNDDLERWSQLVQAGNASQSDLSSRQQNVLSQTALLKSLRRQLLAKADEIEEQRLSKKTLKTEFEQRKSQLVTSKSDMTENLIQLDSTGNQYVVAPIAGTVVAFQGAVGQSINSAVPVAAIVREGDPVEAHLLVPAHSIGFVQVGQAVVVRVDAYPFQRYGSINGKISTVSHTVYRPGELISQISYQESVYRVVVILEQQKMSAYEIQYSFQPGMTLSADIMIDSRRFIDWIFDPIRAAMK